GERLVELAAGAVVPIQPLLDLGAGGQVLHLFQEGGAALDQRFAVGDQFAGGHGVQSSERKPEARTTGAQASRSRWIAAAYSRGVWVKVSRPTCAKAARSAGSWLAVTIDS